MPKFTKEQDPQIELIKLKISFAKKIDAAKQSSDVEQKLHLCKEIIDEYNESMSTLSTMDKYRKMSKHSKEIAINPIVNEVRKQFAIAKEIYGTEQMKRVSDDKNFISLSNHITEVKEVLSLTKKIKNKKELKTQTEEAKNLLKDLENKQQAEEYKQKFAPIAKDAAEKALDRIKQAAQKEAHKQKFAPIANDAAEAAKAKNLSKNIFEELLSFKEQQKQEELRKQHEAKESDFNSETLQAAQQNQHLMVSEDLQRREGESAIAQATRIFQDLKIHLNKFPDSKIGLIYAANNNQAQEFYKGYKLDPIQLPTLNGSGQALLFKELINLLNKEAKDSPEILKKSRYFLFQLLCEAEKTKKIIRYQKWN